MGEKKSPFPITFFQKYNYFLDSINEEAWEYRHFNVRNNNKPMVIIYILITPNCMGGGGGGHIIPVKKSHTCCNIHSYGSLSLLI